MFSNVDFSEDGMTAVVIEESNPGSFWLFKYNYDISNNPIRIKEEFYLSEINNLRGILNIRGYEFLFS
jgi:hypothetical protein